METSGLVYDTYNYNCYKKKVMKILIVDDDENVANSLKDYMIFRGHFVETVNEGSRGLGKNINENYDLIFLDYHLDNDISPGLDETKLNYSSILNGATLGECIKEIKSDLTKKMLIFGYTGDTSLEAINKFKNAGADGVIFKPAEPNLLDKLMANIENNNDIDKFSLIKTLKIYKKNIVIFE
jgi:DNA-binding response OmpR family regulator